MDADRSFDDRLATRLRSLGLGEVASALIEAGAPLAWVGAQLGFMAAPLMGTGIGRDSELIGLLESPQRLAYLCEALHRETQP